MIILFLYMLAIYGGSCIHLLIASKYLYASYIVPKYFEKKEEREKSKIKVQTFKVIEKYTLIFAILFGFIA